MLNPEKTSINLVRRFWCHNQLYYLATASVFYNRQFTTRKEVNHEIISSLNQILEQYFQDNSGLEKGFPSLKFISAKLGVSQRYLNDLLRSLTGNTTQQYIQQKVIEKAKELLSVSSLSVSEIAYQLGFEHPQSFSELFKSKTHFSPTEFKKSFDQTTIDPPLMTIFIRI